MSFEDDVDWLDAYYHTKESTTSLQLRQADAEPVLEQLESRMNLVEVQFRSAEADFLRFVTKVVQG